MALITTINRTASSERGELTLDPQVALQEVRWQIENIRTAMEADSQFDLEQSLEALEEHFEALDGWLRRGGHPPLEWDNR